MKKISCVILLLIMSYVIYGQELRCKVSVNSSKIQGTNRSVFNTLQTSIFEFMNNTKWTNNVYTDGERIDCSIYITLLEQSGNNRYSGNIQVQATRPVYGTTYQTVTFNFRDEDFTIDYIEFDNLDFDLRNFRSNLTSILGYYAYVILGLDYDTFSLKGGTELFENAQTITLNAQKESLPGWAPYDDATHRSRYWLIENILNSKYNTVRMANYMYHRQGLDLLSSDMTRGKSNIFQSLIDLQKVYREKPDSYLLFERAFFDAKSDEIVHIFENSGSDEKDRVYLILKEIDNANLKKYDKLKRIDNSPGSYWKE